MRCENKTFLQNDPGFLQQISSTAVEVGLVPTGGNRQESGAQFLAELVKLNGGEGRREKRIPKSSLTAES